MKYLFNYLSSGFNFSFHLVLNRKVAFKLLLKSLTKLKIDDFLNKSFKVGFGHEDLEILFTQVYRESHCFETTEIDFEIPRKMNTLINFTTAQRAVCYLYHKFPLNFIETVIEKNSIEVKNDLFVAMRKLKEVYI